MIGLPPFAVTRLEKAATDNGFDLADLPVNDWLAFRSTMAPLRIWLTVTRDGRPLAAFSQRNVLQALAGLGEPASGAPPPSAAGMMAVADFAALHHLLRRAFQLSRALPDELLHRFEKATAGLPRATEAERLVVVRVGQNIFREGLMDYWEGRCAITGLAVPELLRASHIKPWAKCASDAERLDVFNGLLLAAHLDAAFDCGFITIGNDGVVQISPTLDRDAQALLGFDALLRVRSLDERHLSYLAWHRERVFRPTTLLESRQP